MRVYITGIAGSLGNSLARLFLNKGYEVMGNDVARLDDAWKLDGIKDKIDYNWKSSMDLDINDFVDTDLIFDCALEFADRPLGISSPTHTLIGNLMPPMRILEVLRKMKEMKTGNVFFAGESIPTVIYASSFNALYGYPPGTCYTEALLPLPSSQYGWSKAAAELLYITYSKAFQIPVIISRVGSAFGPRMRSDELIAKLILRTLRNEPFALKSPGAARLWTYAKDVMSFYDKLTDDLAEDSSKYLGKILHCAGNVGDKIVKNIDLAHMVSDLVMEAKTTLRLVELEPLNITIDDYEPGEIINGKPVSFTVDCSATREMLKCHPKYTLEQGIRETIEWFDESSRN